MKSRPPGRSEVAHWWRCWSRCSAHPCRRGPPVGPGCGGQGAGERGDLTEAGPGGPRGGPRALQASFLLSLSFTWCGVGETDDDYTAGGGRGPESRPLSPLLTGSVPSRGPQHWRAGDLEELRAAPMAAEGLGERAGRGRRRRCRRGQHTRRHGKHAERR